MQKGLFFLTGGGEVVHGNMYGHFLLLVLALHHDDAFD